MTVTVVPLSLAAEMPAATPVPFTTPMSVLVLTEPLRPISAIVRGTGRGTSR